MAEGKPKFDPSKPFKVVSASSTGKPKFDPSKPFRVVGQDAEETAPKSDVDVIAGLRKRRESEIGVDPYSGLPSGGPEQLISNASPEEEDALKRRTREVVPTVAALGTAPLTGGLSLAARLGTSGLAAGGSRLLAGAATGEEPVESVKGAAIEGGLAAAGEGLGSLAAKGLTAAGRRLAGGLLKPTAEGAKAAKIIEAEGGILTPALQSESRTAKILESLAESSVLGSGRVSEVRGQAIEAAQGAVERFAKKVGSGLSREDAGVVVQEAIQGKLDAFREVSEQLYGRVDQAFDDAIQGVLRDAGTVVPAGERVLAEPAVSLVGVKQAAMRLLKEAQQGIPGAELNKILKQVATKPSTVSFKGAARLRSDLLKVTRTGTELLGGQAKGAAKQLAGLVDEALERTAADAGPEVLTAFRDANKFYQEGAKLFNGKLIRQLSSAKPEAIVSAISKARKPGSIREIRTAIGNPKAWEEVQGTYLRELLDTSFENSGDIARGTFLSGKRINTKLANFGEDALNELLGPAKLKAFREFTQALETAQRRTGSGLSGLNIRGGLELYSLGAGNIALALTPAVLARVLTNPQAIRLLTKGFKAPAGSRQATEAITRLSAIAGALQSGEDRKPAQTASPGQ